MVLEQRSGAEEKGLYGRMERGSLGHAVPKRAVVGERGLQGRQESSLSVKNGVGRTMVTRCWELNDALGELRTSERDEEELRRLAFVLHQETQTSESSSSGEVQGVGLPHGDLSF